MSFHTIKPASHSDVAGTGAACVRQGVPRGTINPRHISTDAWDNDPEPGRCRIWRQYFRRSPPADHRRWFGAGNTENRRGGGNWPEWIGRGSGCGQYHRIATNKPGWNRIGAGPGQGCRDCDCRPERIGIVSGHHCGPGHRVSASGRVGQCRTNCQSNGRGNIGSERPGLHAGAHTLRYRQAGICFSSTASGNPVERRPATWPHPEPHATGKNCGDHLT